MRWYRAVVLTSVFLISDDERLMWLLAISIIFGEVAIQFLYLFFNWALCLFLCFIFHLYSNFTQTLVFIYSEHLTVWIPRHRFGTFLTFTSFRSQNSCWTWSYLNHCPKCSIWNLRIVLKTLFLTLRHSLTILLQKSPINSPIQAYTSVFYPH